ncbi:MAG: 4-hydroxy-3-methylbut-2-enyl diphosphate reductase [Chloroflexi bacterium]|nr:4-hydroxy-3-methylbut-2-enyl diphosphate reductase [Chloroflexota bacterium]MCL5074704.1 4-hydroxy-3-methylbut-2-enyl diphosphate reductase [Chloroflexota bacterium]
MEVILAKEMGFCFGVRRAVGLVERAAKEHEQVSTLGWLVHNPQVVHWLEQLGVRVASDLADIDGGAVVIAAYGVPPTVVEEARRRGLKVIDATCPLVKVVQEKARHLSQDGYLVVLFGDPGHAEVKGVLGWTEGKTRVVSNLQDLEGLLLAKKVAVLSQTTQRIGAYEEIVKRLIELQIKQAKEIAVYNTICNATAERQQAALELTKEVDVVVVVGGRESANTRRLAEICRNQGVPTYHIEEVSELRPEWFVSACRVGVTAGASTPDWSIASVLECLARISERT